MRRLPVLALGLATAMCAGLALAGCAAVGPSDIGEDQYGGTVCPAGSMINGMDIAACQAANWPAVKAGGIQFAIIKATEGNGSSWYYVNPRFAGDWSGSKAAGVIRGAYHYFHPELDGKAQADFMMSIINKDGGLLPGDMPPMLDWEEPQCCGSPLPAGCGSASPSCGTPVSTMQANGMAFVNEIKALTGRDTLIYTYPWVWTYVIGAPGWAASYPLDISSFNSCPYVPGPWSNWKVWQYNTCASVAGVSGICGSGCIDVDHFNGDLAAMQAWTGLNSGPMIMRHPRPVDLDGDGRADVCGRGSAGISCALSSGTAFGAVALWSGDFSDSGGWKSNADFWQTIQFPDLDGDGRADVCGRGQSAIYCALSKGTGFAATTGWSGDFTDAGGWNVSPSYWETLQFPDVNGDGRADVCGRGVYGIDCALSSGTGFGAASTWSTDFSDAGGWKVSPSYWQTIQFADVDGDGRADVCGRGKYGIDCALSNGTGFAAATQWLNGYTDAEGWGADPSYWATIQFPDVNGDGRADVCGRGIAGISCALSNGSGFGPASLWSGDYSDSGGWKVSPSYWQTIQFSDLNGDGRADVCGRGQSAIYCALSTGTAFSPASGWSGDFSDSGGWSSSPSYWQTLQFPDLNGDGRADVCGRGEYGIDCSVSTGTGFGAATGWSSDFSDSGGWKVDPSYWATIQM